MGKYLMRILRAVIKTFLFSFITISFYALWLGGLPGVFFSVRAARFWRNLGFRIWAKTIAAVLGIKIETQGIVPVTPFFLVANHLSYLDIIVFAAQLDCVFVAKSEVANWPVIGLLCRSMNTIFIERKRPRDILRVNALLEKQLQAGHSIMLFPEGTTTDGSQLLPFKSALLEPVVKARQAVSYASISYQVPAHELSAAQSVCWWGEMDFLPHLFGFFQLPGCRATVRFGDEAIVESDRKVLAKKLHAAVSNKFIPVQNEFALPLNPDLHGLNAQKNNPCQPA